MNKYPKNNPILERGERSVFFDNLRYLFVVGVVFQHAGMAYIDSPWWPVTDGTSIFARLATAFCDGFLMPSLFYISGYFALPSIRCRSISKFIAAKFKRLGIPWLVCTLFIGPMWPFIYQVTRNGWRSSNAFLDTWSAVMGNALNFNLGVMPPMVQVMRENLFYQRYMWFIGVLLTFFCLFSILYRARRSWFEPENEVIALSSRVTSPLKVVATIGLSTFSGSTLLIGVMFMTTSHVSDPESWFTLGNIIQFRVSRIFLHAVYFVLGILTYKKRWIEQNFFPNASRYWISIFAMVMLLYFATAFCKELFGEFKQLWGVILWFWLNFFTISALGTSLFLSHRYLNQVDARISPLAADSFNIYLAHYPFVVFFQLLFSVIPVIIVPLKLIFVALLSLFCAHGVSRLLLQPHPRLTIFLLMGLFVAMAAIFR